MRSFANRPKLQTGANSWLRHARAAPVAGSLAVWASGVLRFDGAREIVEPVLEVRHVISHRRKRSELRLSTDRATPVVNRARQRGTRHFRTLPFAREIIDQRRQPAERAEQRRGCRKAGLEYAIDSSSRRPERRITVALLAQSQRSTITPSPAPRCAQHPEESPHNAVMVPYVSGRRSR